MRMESFHVYSESIKKTERCSVGIRGETKYCIPLYERARVLLDVLFSPPTFRIAPILVIRTGRKRNKKIWSEKSRLANDSGGGSEEQKKKQTRRVVKKSRAGDEAIQPLRRNKKKGAMETKWLLRTMSTLVQTSLAPRARYSWANDRTRLRPVKRE